jgi:hypothetical protein
MADPIFYSISTPARIVILFNTKAMQSASSVDRLIGERES